MPGFEFASDNTLADQANFTDAAITEMQQWGFIRIAYLWNLNYAAQGGYDLSGSVGDNVAWSMPVAERRATKPTRSRGATR